MGNTLWGLEQASRRVARQQAYAREVFARYNGGVQPRQLPAPKPAEAAKPAEPDVSAVSPDTGLLAALLYLLQG